MADSPSPRGISVFYCSFYQDAHRGGATAVSRRGAGKPSQPNPLYYNGGPVRAVAPTHACPFLEESPWPLLIHAESMACEFWLF